MFSVQIISYVHYPMKSLSYGSCNHYMWSQSTSLTRLCEKILTVVLVHFDGFREHKHLSRQCAPEGKLGWLEGTHRGPEWCEQLSDDRWGRVRWCQGIQRQQGLQHAHYARVPSAVPWGDWDHLCISLPRLHRHNRTVPWTHSPVQAPLSALRST